MVLVFVCLLTFLDEPVSSYAQVGSALTVGSRPSTPLRRSNDGDTWTSSTLHAQSWNEKVTPFPSDEANLSPGKRRLGDLPRSTSPFHSLQETRHRQAAAAQAAALGHSNDSGILEDPSRTLSENTSVEHGRGEELARNGSVDLFHQQQTSRQQRPFDTTDGSGRTIRGNILGTLEDDFIRQPFSRTRVHTLDPSFSLEPLQRANSTPPYSGPIPISSRDLPHSGLNPYPQSRTPQLQSSGHFTALPRDDLLSSGLRDLSLEPRSAETPTGRRLSNTPPVSNVGSGYSSGEQPYIYC